MDRFLDGLWQRYWEVAKSRMRGPTERSRWRMGFCFALVPSCIPPLSFSLLIVHLESDLLLPLTFIQPILCFTVTGCHKWLWAKIPEILSQNSYSSLSGFFNYLATSVTKLIHAVWTPHAALSILSLFIDLFNCLVCLYVCGGQSMTWRLGSFFLPCGLWYWTSITGLMAGTVTHRATLSSRTHTRLWDLEAEISFSLFLALNKPQGLSHSKE